MGVVSLQMCEMFLAARMYVRVQDLPAPGRFRPTLVNPFSSMVLHNYERSLTGLHTAKKEDLLVT